MSFERDKATSVDLVLFEAEARDGGLGAELATCLERGDAEAGKTLVDRLAALVPDHFPEGYKVLLIADLSSFSPLTAGVAIRVQHPSITRPWGSIPIRLPRAETSTEPEAPAAHIWVTPTGRDYQVCRRCLRVRQASGSTDAKVCKAPGLSLRDGS